MVVEALDKLYPKSNIEKYRRVMTINASENDLIDTMKKVPSNIDLSSLPKILGDKRKVVISLAGYYKDEVEKYFRMFVDYCVEFEKEFVFEDVSLDKEKI
jgi:hypothetical protein